ncbi:MAG TPA: DUF1573 domain-containing protein [Ferruginibacter sp.]|nr:DUF1573 domain-containing protein [Ferruginibacter sp.]
MHRRDKLVDDASIRMDKELQDSTMVQVMGSTFKFDTTTEGEKVTHNFAFKNTGTNPLIIIKATASCGCTVADKPEQPILPGDTGYIKVIFNTTGKRGHNQKSITVISNAHPDFPRLILMGEVKAPIAKN